MGGFMTHPSPPQRRALTRLASGLPDDAYLAGGGAVAVRYGHRVSRDLEVFTTESDPELVVEPLRDDPNVVVTTRSEGSVYLEVGEVPVSITANRSLVPPSS